MSGESAAPAPPRPPGREPSLRTWISPDPLDPVAVVRDVGDRRDGGVVLFVGRVRASNRGRRVTRLAYEAYREMAEEELARIASEVGSRSAVGAIAAVHRVGELEPGEPSVVVAVAAPHRAAAYEASRTMIEEIKTRLPIWKREMYADGTECWLGAEEPPEARGRSDAGAASPAVETRTGQAPARSS